MTEEYQGLHVKFNFMNRRLSELEASSASHTEKEDKGALWFMGEDMIKMDKKIEELELAVEAIWDKEAVKEHLIYHEVILKKEIAELREKTNNYTEMALEMTRAYHELKERFGNYVSSNQFYHVLQYYANKDKNLEEVLRDHIESHKFKINYEEASLPDHKKIPLINTTLDKQLEKLDGKTEICKSIPQCITTNNCVECTEFKGSGGEKDSDKGERKTSGQSLKDDSKPPEPIPNEFALIRKPWEKKHRKLEDKYDHYVCERCMEIGAKEVISDFIEDIDEYLECMLIDKESVDYKYWKARKEVWRR